MIGAQASSEQLAKIQSYLDIGRKEGAKLLCGGEISKMGGDMDGGYFYAISIEFMC